MQTCPRRRSNLCGEAFAASWRRGGDFTARSTLIKELIIDTVTHHPEPRPQVGEPLIFHRCKPADGYIAGPGSLGQIHDYIRMLDAQGYPSALLKVGSLRLTFSRSRLDEYHVLGIVQITIISDEETP